MKIVTLILAVLLAAAFLFFGVQKFGATNPVFSIIADRSGIALFEPVVRMATGVAEVLTALLLLVPVTRYKGALLGLLVMIGAIGFHLSPWLGINVPGIGSSLFYMAVVMLIAVIALNVLLKKQTAATL